MRLRLAAAEAIKSKVAEISRIGESVNDPGLYQRIEEACLKKRAFLFVSQDGFLVLLPVAGPGVLIWVAHSHDAVDRPLYSGEIDALAKDIDAKQISFWSNRKGFHRIAPRYGYTSRPDVWMGKPITVWTKNI